MTAVPAPAVAQAVAPDLVQAARQANGDK